jgi:serine/threonine-protein kinase
VLSGLAVAHAQGVVHRDLKPDNIFLARLSDGTVQPKLIDFGVAHVTMAAVSSKLTTAGMLLGTPEYMAPEQIESRDDIDARADVWAAGVTLYALITGAVPFAGESLHDLFDAILEAHVPYPTRARGLDGRLWSILTDCLRRDRAERFQSAEEVERALAGWLAQRGALAEREPSSAPVHKAMASTLPPTLPSAARATPGEGEPGVPAVTLDRAIFSALKKTK